MSYFSLLFSFNKSDITLKLKSIRNDILYHSITEAEPSPSGLMLPALIITSAPLHEQQLNTELLTTNIQKLT